MSGRNRGLYGRIVACLAGLAVCAGLAQAAEFNPPTLHSDGGAWPIRRNWTFEETQHYAKWVSHIFHMKTEGTTQQRAAKLVQVLTDPAINKLLDPEFAGEGCNPQLAEPIMWTMHNIIDCGKLTVALPGYYAYRRALPWMVSYVRSGDGGDVRTAAYTLPAGTLDTLASPSPDHFFTNAVYGFCTGNYRVEPYGDRSELSDTVPVAIDRKYLIPGCPAYTDGHSLILAKVDPYGELYFLDASTVASRDLFTHNGMNCVVGITARRQGEAREFAGCYRGLRVYRYPIAEADETGKVKRVRRRTDLEMKEFGYSVEQFDKMAELVGTKTIAEGSVKLDSFNDFIRFRMKSVDKVAPAKFLNAYADSLLEMFKQREELVQAGWKEVNTNGPIEFPDKQYPQNIFNAGGRWGQWSSCADDVDRRNRYIYLATWMDDVIRSYERMPDYVDLTGLERYPILNKGDLAQALTLEKTRVFNTKSMTYINSQDKVVRLSLLEIERRLFDLSFDPNHPPELRWGAPLNSVESASCTEIPTPLPDGSKMSMAESYKLEAFYRTVSIKETEQSYMREACTTGFSAPSRFNSQLAKWYAWNQPKDIPTLVPSRVASNAAPVAKKAVKDKPKRFRIKRFNEDT
ncbi:MAG: hypothetical protein RBU21_20280 [FCB group bacterium]|jgi:hypothetical protein|nr:hypothetical protein [FCB group bacterium]